VNKFTDRYKRADKILKTKDIEEIRELIEIDRKLIEKK